MAIPCKRRVLVALAALVLAVGGLGMAGTLGLDEAAAGFNNQMHDGTDGAPPGRQAHFRHGEAAAATGEAR